MWWIWVALLLIVAAAAFGAALWRFSEKVVGIKVWDEKRIIQFETDIGVLDPAYLEALPKEDVAITSPYGYALSGWFIPCGTDSNKTVILAHGVTRSRMSSIKYVELFRKRGFHVLAYDHRRHGKSGGASTTYGFYEKEDLRAWVDWVYRRMGPGAVVGTHGESMGAATVLQHAAVDDRVRFCIADCPYSGIVGQLIYRLKVEYPRFPVVPTIPLVAMICRLRSGARLDLAESLRSLPLPGTPVLFIHGQEDKYIEKRMTEEMFQLKQGTKRLYLAPGADHAEAYMKNPDEYNRIVGEFLQEAGVLGG
jgi:fermentation-respiration switch protein FrsA (DUF1100 family)